MRYDNAILPMPAKLGLNIANAVNQLHTGLAAG